MRYLGGTLLLWLAFALMLHGLERFSLSAPEARHVAVIHDAAPMPESPRAALRYSAASLRDALANSQAAGLNPLYVVVLDGWALLFGESVIMLRLLSALMALLVLAVVVSLLGRLHPAIGLAVGLWLMTHASFLAMARSTQAFALGWMLAALVVWLVGRVLGWSWRLNLSLGRARLLLLMAGLFALFQCLNMPAVLGNRPPWEDVVREVATLRDPLEPVLAIIAPDSPLAYYDRQHGLTAGLALRVGWREQTRPTIREHAQRLTGAASVWLIAPINDERTEAARAVLSRGRSVGYNVLVGTVRLVRFDRDVRPLQPSTPAIDR